MNLSLCEVGSGLRKMVKILNGATFTGQSKEEVNIWKKEKKEREEGRERRKREIENKGTKSERSKNGIKEKTRNGCVKGEEIP